MSRGAWSSPRSGMRQAVVTRVTAVAAHGTATSLRPPSRAPVGRFPHGRLLRVNGGHDVLNRSAAMRGLLWQERRRPEGRGDTGLSSGRGSGSVRTAGPVRAPSRAGGLRRAAAARADSSAVPAHAGRTAQPRDDPARAQGWQGQATDVAARAATGCLTGLTSRGECLLGAATETSNAFFDEPTLGRDARRFAETEYDGDPVRERLEAAASRPIDTARQVGTLGKVVSSAFETTGQVLGRGVAHLWDAVNGGSIMPGEEYLRNLGEMGGPVAGRRGQLPHPSGPRSGIPAGPARPQLLGRPRPGRHRQPDRAGRTAGLERRGRTHRAPTRPSTTGTFT